MRLGSAPTRKWKNGGPVKPLPNVVCFPQAFSPEECDKLTTTITAARRVRRYAEQSLAKRVDMLFVGRAEARWLYDRMRAIGRAANVWRLRLTEVQEPIRVQRYRRADYNGTHTDYDYPDCDYSKLTIVVPLVGARAWKGGALEVGNSAEQPKARRGDAVVFPSFLAHRVTRVLSGTRIVLTGWIVGPPLR
jgi:PKHD-type hydroxylase